MSDLVDRLACLELAETLLERECARAGTDPLTSARVLSLATAIQEAIEAWAEPDADERDRRAHERPNVPPTPFGPEDSWEGRCNGNKSMHHLAPSAKLAGAWRCGSCGVWLTPPKGRT